MFLGKNQHLVRSNEGPKGREGYFIAFLKLTSRRRYFFQQSMSNKSSEEPSEFLGTSGKNDSLSLKVFQSGTVALLRSNPLPNVFNWVHEKFQVKKKIIQRQGFEPSSSGPYSSSEKFFLRSSKVKIKLGFDYSGKLLRKE